MFDLRYHVASLAAVFLALVIGILVGVGISDPVDKATTGLLEERIANLQKQLDQSSQQSTSQARERAAAQTYINETYPVLVRNRLRNKQIAVVFVGSVDNKSRSAVQSALTDSGAQQVRLRAIKVPLTLKQIDSALASQPDGARYIGRGKVEDLGRALGEELMLGGETPLWDALTDAIVEERVGGNRKPADGVVVVRTASPQRGITSRFLMGLYSGLAATSLPSVGAERTDSAHSAVSAYRQAGLSTVDDIDTPAGRLALVLLLDGASPGQYGLRPSADAPLPQMQVPAAAGG